MAPFPTFEEMRQELESKMDRLGTKLVTGDGPPLDVAYLSNLSWERYVVGYKEAADILVERMHEKGHWEELLCFPILFLYRNFIEIELKRITAMAQTLRTGKAQPTNTTHDLRELWGDFEDVAVHFVSNDTREANQLARVRERVLEFAELDPSSFSFRYPTDRKSRQVRLPVGRINVRNLSEVIDAISLFFDGWDGYLDDGIRSIPQFE